MLEHIVTTVTNNPIRYAAPVVAGVFLVVTFYQARKGARGPGADFWERIRGAVIPLLDAAGRALDVGYAAYTVGFHEYAGTLEMPVEQAEKRLYENGFRRNPIAAYKTLPDGREEQGSWVYRKNIFAKHQLHVMLFRRPDGGTDLFAHWELSVINPLTALSHYRGKRYSPKKGERKLEKLLPDGVLVEKPVRPEEKQQQTPGKQKKQQQQQQSTAGTTAGQ